MLAPWKSFINELISESWICLFFVREMIWLGHLLLQGTKINSKGKEVPLGTRLYSIASSRYGDKFDGNTTSLCVRRATYWDADMGKEDPAKKGICSNFLCDAKKGQEISMTGRFPLSGLK